MEHGTYRVSAEKSGKKGGSMNLATGEDESILACRRWLGLCLANPRWPILWKSIIARACTSASLPLMYKEELRVKHFGSALVYFYTVL
jgi:hypothetical protein